MRRLLVCFVSLEGLAAGLAVPVHAERIAGVRSGDARLVETIRAGAEQSRTFADLVHAVTELDGIVYVEPGTCRRHARACLTAQVTTAGRHRILFVRVNEGLPESLLIELIAHELQHAVEVLSDPSVISDASLLILYRRIGIGGADPMLFETRAAIDMQAAVRREVRLYEQKSADR
jgi:hypothetical protein